MLSEFFSSFAKMFSYDFMINAVVAGTALALCASLLGVSLVLKRFSMIGDGLSHIGFGALAIASALNLAPLSFAVPAVIIAALLLMRLSNTGKLKGDSAVALISASAMAVGVIAVSLSGSNIDLNAYLFGTVLSVTKENMYAALALCAVVCVLFVLMYHRLFAVTFDENFAKATGVKTGILNSVCAVLSAVTVVVGMRLMGALLISSLIIFPALTSMRVFKSFKSVSVSSAVVSVLCYFTGVTVSYFISTPTGATVVVTDLVVFLIFSLIGGIKNRIKSGRKKQTKISL